jgi:hypothetical protein
MTPGKEKTVLFRANVASGTTAKEYDINMVIKYTDERGLTALSSVMMVPERVNPQGPSLLTDALNPVGLISARLVFFIAYVDAPPPKSLLQKPLN